MDTTVEGSDIFKGLDSMRDEVMDVVRNRTLQLVDDDDTRAMMAVTVLTMVALYISSESENKEITKRLVAVFEELVRQGGETD